MLYICYYQISDRISQLILKKERFISNWWSFLQCLLKYNILKICSRQGKIEFLLAVSLLALYCGYNEAKDTKPILEEFRKDYSSITKACKAVGFVRDNCSTRGISLDFFTFLFFFNISYVIKSSFFSCLSK